ncbi:MAG: response regulator [Gallionella sp.]|nr:response regulator [Gallionella sp.]
MLKVLVVDDHSDIRRLLTVTLGSEFNVLEAEDGEIALKVINKESPDVVLLDIMMPGKFDGLQVLDQIRSFPETAKTKVAMLTARGQAYDVEEGKSRGADAYFIKPFSPLQVINWVRSQQR